MLDSGLMQKIRNTKLCEISMVNTHVSFQSLSIKRTADCRIAKGGGVNGGARTYLIPRKPTCHRDRYPSYFVMLEECYIHYIIIRVEKQGSTRRFIKFPSGVISTVTDC